MAGIKPPVEQRTGVLAIPPVQQPLRPLRVVAVIPVNV
jgi:hypothetical protein